MAVASTFHAKILMEMLVWFCDQNQEEMESGGFAEVDDNEQRANEIPLASLRRSRSDSKLSY